MSEKRPSPRASLEELQLLLNPVLPMIAAKAEASNQMRDTPSETIAALRNAGLLRLYQPARWGGHETDPRVFYALQNSIAEHCASTAWVFGVLCVQAAVVALFSDHAQRDVWGTDPMNLVASAFAPVGTANSVEGGLRLSGRWSFASGCTHAQWVLLGTKIAGEAVPRIVLVPASDYRIEDVWHTFGLRGTGSNDIVVNDVFVPDYRITTLGPGVQTLPVSARPGPILYRLPWLYIFTGGISNFAIGTARGALRAFIAFNRTRVSPMSGKIAAQDPAVLSACARLAAQIDTVEAMYNRHVEKLTAFAETETPISLEDGWLIRAQLTSGLRSIAACVDDLMLLQGARAIHLDSPVARAWLDLAAARAHIGNDPTLSSAMLGTAMMQE